MSKSSYGSLSMAIVAGLRTPFCKVNGALQGASAADLATHAFRELLDRTRVRREEIDEVILGCAGPDAREANIARTALRLLEIIFKIDRPVIPTGGKRCIIFC